MFSDAVVTSKAGTRDRSLSWGTGQHQSRSSGYRRHCTRAQGQTLCWCSPRAQSCSGLQQAPVLLGKGTVTEECPLDRWEDINNMYLEENKQDSLSVLLSQPATSTHVGSQTNMLSDSYSL